MSKNNYFVIEKNKLIGLTDEGMNNEIIEIPNVNVISRKTFWQNSIIKSIVIPNNVIAIGPRAFLNCLSLKEITNNSLVLFDWWVQHHDYNGQTLNQMSSIILSQFANSDGQPFSAISTGAFSGCKMLQSFITSENIFQISSNAFENCSWLQQVTISKSVNQIGHDIFKGCPSLTSTGVINHSPVLFDWWVQHHDYNGQTLNQMTDIDLNNFTNNDGQPFVFIAPYAFKKCSKLQTIEISKTITSIGSRAFSGCKRLKKIVIPTSIEHIGFQAFSHLSKAKNKKIAFEVFDENTKNLLLNSHSGIQQSQIKLI